MGLFISVWITDYLGRIILSLEIYMTTVHVMALHTVTSGDSFQNFIWRIQINRIWLFAALASSLILFFIFKLFNPYPNMVMDSYVYIRAMAFDLGANSFPIGYSRFLQLFSLFSRSTTLLVWLQFLMLEGACLFLFFTLLFFFRPGKWAAGSIFVFLFFNPLFFYISNFIMADALFSTLSLLWLTQLIWIIARPKPYMILVHALLLVVVFTVRYNALYYPIAASFAILFSHLRPWLKATAIALQFVLIGVFVLYTSTQMQKVMGVRQFSPFGGWKLASNALYMYGHVCQERKDPIPPQFAQLDNMVRGYFQQVQQVDDLLDYESFSTGTFYGAYPGSPLILYMDLKYGVDTVFQNFSKWGPMGAYCGEYGSYLLRKYPLQFARYFVCPNIIRYVLPPREIFTHVTPYYLRTDELGQVASKWFGLTTLTIPASRINFRTTIISPYPIFIALIHLAFILGFIGFILFGGFKKVTKTHSRIILAIGALWLCDFGFSVTASAIVLRYQIFMMIVEFTFAILFMDFIYHNSDKKPHLSPQ